MLGFGGGGLGAHLHCICMVIVTMATTRHPSSSVVIVLHPSQSLSTIFAFVPFHFRFSPHCSLHPIRCRVSSTDLPQLASSSASLLLVARSSQSSCTKSWSPICCSSSSSSCSGRDRNEAGIRHETVSSITKVPLIEGQSA